MTAADELNSNRHQMYQRPGAESGIRGDSLQKLHLDIVGRSPAKGSPYSKVAACGNTQARPSLIRQPSPNDVQMNSMRHMANPSHQKDRPVFGSAAGA